MTTKDLHDNLLRFEGPLYTHATSPGAKLNSRLIILLPTDGVQVGRVQKHLPGDADSRDVDFRLLAQASQVS